MEIGSVGAHIVYLVIVLIGFGVSFGIVEPKRILDPRRIGCIYYAFMFATYFFRPLLEYVLFRDDSLLVHIDSYYEPVTFGDSTVVIFGVIVAISLITFALAYRFQSPKSLNSLKIAHSYPQKQLVRYGYWGLIVFGYIGFLVASKGGGAMVRTDTGTGMVGTTGYLFLINYMIAAGCILRYSVTGQFILSALIGIPWLLVHLYNGFNRYIIITFIIGLGVLWLSRQGRGLTRKFLPLFCIFPVILFVFNILHVNRKAFSDSKDLAYAVERVLETPFNTYFRGFAGHEGGLITLDRHNKSLDKPNYGTHLVYKTVIWPIPRMLWSGKPYPPEFSWKYIFTLGQDRTLDYDYASVFHIFFVRGSIGLDIQEWGHFLFWINPLWLGLLAGFIERKCLVPNGHPILYALYAVFFASFILIGRNTIYELAGPYIYAFYLPYILLYFLTASMNGYKQPKQIYTRNHN
jgi:hypothetical protein